MPIIACGLRIHAAVLVVAWLAHPVSDAAESQPGVRGVAAIRVPPGFEVDVVAAPPLVMHPVMAGFDEQGRLFVADNAGVNYNAEQLLAELPNCVRVLEDTDGDGRFDKSTVFANRMTFPMGALHYRGALYVASPPYIWRLEDSDGDGLAERRDPIVGQFGFIGNAADIHGCFLGPDGRIYWSDGRHGHNFEGADGRPLSQGQAARIFSCRPDGSDIETFCGGGMDNPVEIAFADSGEMFGTMTFYNPNDERHDALVHYVHGGVYPRNHPCVSEFKSTGDYLPPLSLFGVVAPSGLMRYRGTQPGGEFEGNLFSTQFNTHKVVRHVLSRNGATFSSQDEDFLVSADIDFHPCDVLEDADGSLLVIDTGGWFRIGCPTSQLAKPEVHGAIYRVRRTGATRIEDPRGLRLTWSEASANELAQRLGDPRHAVRDRAVDELARRGGVAVASLTDVLSNDPRHIARNMAVWSLARIGQEAAAPIRRAIDDTHMDVPLAALCSLGALRDTEAIESLSKIVIEGELPLRREAATALGRIGRPEAVHALLESLGKGGDRFVEHAVIYALIQINDRAGTREGLAHANPDVRRGALVALDQMDGGALTRDQIAPLLDTSDVALRNTLLEVISRRESWAAEIVSLLGVLLAEADLPPEQASLVEGAVMAFRTEPRVQELVGAALSKPGLPPAARVRALTAIGRTELAPLPEAWLDALRRILDAMEPTVVHAAVLTVGSLGESRFDDRLLEIAHDADLAPATRVAALAAMARRGRPLDELSFAFLVEAFGQAVSSVDRLVIAETLAQAPLAGDQASRLVPLVREAGPLELPALAAAISRPPDVDTARRLLDALAASSGLESLGAARLERLVAEYPSDVRETADSLLVRLSTTGDEKRAQIDQWDRSLEGGDPQRGKTIFHGRKAACAACHRVGNEGSNVGPDLTTIGQVRTRRDVLESVLLPSLTLARGYESYTIATASGQVHTGIVSRHSPDAIYLRTAERAEIRIERANISEMAPSPVSIMPEGLERTMTPGELADLLAYVESLK